MSDRKQFDNPRTDREIIDACIDYIHRSEEAESTNRQKALEARKFRYGEQWPPELVQSRFLDQRPCLTINKVDAYCLQVSNQQRQQRPRIKVDPTGGGATKKTADVIKGLIRNIEHNEGGADLSYDTGFDNAITEGWGYWRVIAQYVGEDSFEQELVISPLDNVFACYGDPNSGRPDGSDQEEFAIVEDMSQRTFRAKYPGKDDGSNFEVTSLGNSGPSWLTKDSIRVAEYYAIRQVRDTLVQLSDGSTGWLADLPSESQLRQMRLQVVDKRTSMRRRVCWYKMTAMEILERRDSDDPESPEAALPGRYIPVVKICGKVEVIDGKRRLSGLVKNAIDPQRQLNFQRTSSVESLALAPKAKWLIAEGQDEGHENEWAKANTSATAALRYKHMEGVERPQRVQPEGPPVGSLELAQNANQDLTAVLGIVDPVMRVGGNVSGKALRSERMQSENSTFHYYDNMTRSIRFTGVILLDLIPHYYSEQRVERIIGDDGRTKMVTLNEQSQEGEGPTAIQRVLNDVTVGKYDVVMDTGPGYETKRQEAAENLMPMMKDNEQLMEKAGDLLFRSLDFEGAEVIADRLAASNPLASIDEASDIPAPAQMQMKQMDATIKQLTQQLQAAGMEIKTKQGIEQMRQEGETKRTLMKVTGDVHRNEQDNAAWANDVQTKAITAMNVAELKGLVDLLKNRLDREAENFHREADREQATEIRREEIEQSKLDAMNVSSPAA